MTKAELVETVARATRQPKKIVATTIDLAFDQIARAIRKDKRFWVPRSRRTRQVRPDVSGRFIARDLPAGDYLIAAVTDVEDGQWNDPAFLAALAASSPIPIALVEGDKKVQNIRIGGR